MMFDLASVGGVGRGLKRAAGFRWDLVAESTLAVYRMALDPGDA